MSSKEKILKLVDIIKSGGVVAFPTETVYALACDATNVKAVERIYSIKKRDNTKPLSVIVSNIENIKRYAHVGGVERKIIESFSPGPITYVLEIRDKKNLSDLLIKDNNLGFRIPDHQLALEILSRCNMPLVATSVNLSGEKSATNIDEISGEMKKNIDFIVDGKPGKGISSTVVKLSKGSVEILREGEIEIYEIMKVISN